MQVKRGDRVRCKDVPGVYEGEVVSVLGPCVIVDFGWTARSVMDTDITHILGGGTDASKEVRPSNP